MRSLVLAAMSAALLAGAPAQAQQTGLDREIDTLTARVERLEGARAVMRLQRAFGYYVDRGLWQDAADLFAEHGSIEIGLDGVYVGRDRIRDYLKALHGGQEGLIYGQLNEWITLQPVVTVAADGRSAIARWRDQGMLGQHKQNAQWRDGIYENDYVKEGGVWKIRVLRLHVNFVVPAEKGWARLATGEGIAQSETSKTMSPDRPSTMPARAFPETQIPAFRTPNPVTGKSVTETAK